MTQRSLILSQGRDDTYECFGHSFVSIVKLQEHFLPLLEERLALTREQFPHTFPDGERDRLISLSQAPWYTPFPNPFTSDFVEYHRTQHSATEHRRIEPFTSDVTEGKGDAVYNAHAYHTKVPHKAIMRYILHYTEPGDIVFDGFCGTGMTGVAAQLCGSRQAVEALGYSVTKDGEVHDSIGTHVSHIGTRPVILGDLSTAATFISTGYNLPPDPGTFVAEAEEHLASVRNKWEWMFCTLHAPKKKEVDIAVEQLESISGNDLCDVMDIANGRVHYVIWSDTFMCPECSDELVFWDEAVDQNAGKVHTTFPCPNCDVALTKRRLQLAMTTVVDPLLNKTAELCKQTPVLINYSVGGRTHQKKPDEFDLCLLRRIAKLQTAEEFVIARMPEGDESRRNDSRGMTHIHHFYSDRNRLVLGALLADDISPACRWTINGILHRASKQHQIAITRIGGEKAGEGGATAGHRRGTWYVPSNQVEYNALHLFKDRITAASKAFAKTQYINRDVLISTCSASNTGIPSASVDYIFVDPPFGGNIMYSELNFVWESVLGVITNTDKEAIQNKTQGKKLDSYREIMVECFMEFNRILKSGQWMTVVFHNSKNSVWNAIQEALQRAKFVVADVRTLDKKLMTHTQRTAAGSVNKDLVISAYKPSEELESDFQIKAGSDEAAWDFVASHLGVLPTFVGGADKCELLPERQKHLLYDRMVAFHVQRGVLVPMSAAEFYAGLTERFPERDEMFFLPEQVGAYEKKRLQSSTVIQGQLFVTDEQSAVEWLRHKLAKSPQTFQDMQPQFMKKAGWDKHEKELELSELLEQNFLCYDGKEVVPSQIHSYLSSNFKDARNLAKDDSKLKNRAKGRWYVPDPRKEVDLEKIRLRTLLKEFEEYRTGAAKKIKQFRTEAVRAGFKHCYDEQDYQTIVDVAAKLPEKVIQEDMNLLMYYDVATTRLGS